MKTKIKFSVVIPAYNRADLIGETIESVLTQSYPDFEVIVVDNKSTDSTVEVVSSYTAKDARVKLIQHDKNYERSKSRNTGIQHATGDFLTFLDSDDFMYSNCLADAWLFIENNPEIKFFQNLYELVNDKREVLYKYDFPELDNQYLALASGNFVSCIGNFLHKDIYKNIRFSEDPRMIGSEDYEVWFHVLAQTKIGRINKINSGIREHPYRSVNQGIYNNLVYQRDKILEIINHNPTLFDKFGKYLARLQASFLLQEAIALNQLKQKGASFKRLMRAVQVDFTILFRKRFYSVLYNILK